VIKPIWKRKIEAVTNFCLETERYSKQFILISSFEEGKSQLRDRQIHISEFT
jgi:hypothetical protein